MPCYQDSNSFRGKHCHIPDAGCQQRGWRSCLWVQCACVAGAGGVVREEKGPDLLILRLLSFDSRGLCFWVALCRHSGQLLGSLGSMDSAKSYVAARTCMVLCSRKSNGGCAWKPGGAGLLDEGQQLRRKGSLANAAGT